MPELRPLGPGKERLLDAAELLMDERGIDGVSMREIRIASGHKNPSAVQYHFGDRDTMVHQMFYRRVAGIDEHRNALLDALEADGHPGDVRQLLGALVDPMLARLDTAEGRRFWRLVQQLMHHPNYRAQVYSVSSLAPGIERIRMLIVASGAIDHVPVELRLERADQLAGLIVRSLAERSVLLDADESPRVLLAADVFRANLLDTAEAVLCAPSSAPTSAHPTGASSSTDG
jgi:AcrR family transcriptional regulator